MGCRAFALLGCLWPRWCSGRRRARPLCVPVGGGPPASRPHRELRSARRLEARPGPATAHRHRGQALRTLRRPPHQWGWVAVNSPARPRCRPPALRPGPPDPPAPSTPAALALRGVAWRVGSKPGQALPSLLAPRVNPSRPSMLSPRPISHVIPLRLFQILNSDRWNCNVFGLC